MTNVFNNEELIESLRLWNRDDAADRIEQLVATNEALTSERDRWKDACRSASRDLNIVVPDNDRLKSERDALTAKLAKAVEALRGSRETILQLVNSRGSEAEGTDEDWVGDIDTTLAEIKLQSSEFATQKRREP